MSSTIISRLQLDHPDLGTAGGSALHASIAAIYTKIGNNISTRILTAVNLNNAATATVEHDLRVALSEVRYDLYLYDEVTTELTRVTSTSTPSLSQFTIAANGTNPTTQVDITNNSGAQRDLALVLIVDPIYLKEGDVKDIDISTTAPEDGQSLVWDAATSKFKPGASGDASFKLQSVATPNATVKGGYLLLDDGRELGTYDGAGSLSTDFGKDLTINLTTILGGSPADATAYYLYLDLNTLSSATTQTDTGRVVYPITQSNYVLSTSSPELMDRSRYIPRGVLKTATTGNAWSGSGSAYATLASLAGQTVDAKVKSLLAVNYIDVPTPESNIGSAATYADAAAATPADGTGGTPNVTLVRNTTSPIRGIADYKFSKDAVNRQGQGFAIPFTIPATDKNMKARIKFRYNASHASYVAGDLAIYVYDVTNSALVTPVFTALPKNTGIFETAVDLTTGTSYRLIVHVASTNASAYDVYLDDISVDAERQGAAVAISDWQAYTPTFGGFGTVSGVTAWYRRVGDTMDIKGTFTTGTVAASAARISLPSGFTLNTSAITRPGLIAGVLSANWSNTAGARNSVDAFFASGQTTNVSFCDTGSGAASNVLSEILGNAGWNSTTQHSFAFSGIPIAEWAGSGTLNVGGADIEYAYNSSTSTTTDSTSFGYGPTGVLFTAVTAGITKRVRFPTAYRDTDRIVLECREGTDGPWLELGQFIKSNGDGIDSFTYQSAVAFGAAIRKVSGSTTDIDVQLAQYAQQAAASYGGAGIPWSNYTGVYWRLKKTRAGAAVGFGLADSNGSAGLVNPYSPGTGVVYSANYTPTLTNVANAGSLAVENAWYQRVGKVVTVYGSITLTPAAGAGTATAVGITLPIASALTSANQLRGMGIYEAASRDVAYVGGDATNDRAELSFKANSTTNDRVGFHFSYVIL